MTLLEQEEKYLREMLAMLQDSYAKAAKPYLDKLVEIQSLRIPSMVISVDDAIAAGIIGSKAGGDDDAA